MSRFGLVNDLSILLVGRRPDYKIQRNYLDPPTAKSDGISLRGSPLTSLIITPRRNSAYHTVEIALETLDPGEDFTVTVEGSASTYTSKLTDEKLDVLEGLKDAINENGAINSLVEAEIEVGREAILVLRGKGGDYYSTDVATTGDGELIQDPDATYAIVQLHVRPDGAGFVPATWILKTDDHYNIPYVDDRAFQRFLPTASFSRLAVEVLETDGKVHVYVGPTIEERI